MAKFNIDTVRAAADLVSLAEAAGAKLKRSGRTWSGACPLHHGKNPVGFNIYRAKDGLRWKCFTGDCGGGDSIAFVMEWQNVDFSTACHIILGESNIDPERLAEIVEQRETWIAQEQVAFEQQVNETIIRIENEKLWEKYAGYQTPESRQLWENEGIPEVWQSIWSLGYSPDYQYYEDKSEHHSPTLTIPIFSYGWKIRNIRHRLLEPISRGSKYRPQYYGMPAYPFIADPDLPQGEGEKIIITEGEKKAMVTFIALDEPGTQVIGIPGKEWLKDGGIIPYTGLIENVFICLDPDACEAAENMAKMIGSRARILDLPYKIDDMIRKFQLEKSDLRSLLKTARRINHVKAKEKDKKSSR